jgi:DNA repair photolyase
MPSEKIKRNTYHAIRMLNHHGNNYLIVTKSAMVADDEYIKVMDKNKAHIQITVTTLNDDFCSTYEKASKPSERIKAILKLQDAGFDVQIRLSPYIPQFVDLDRLASTGINRAVVEFLRVNTWIRKWFDIDYSEYTVKHAGYQHLPLSKKIEYIKPLQSIFKEITVCEDEDEAYQYWHDNVNPNPNDCCNLRLIP